MNALKKYIPNIVLALALLACFLVYHLYFKFQLELATDYQDLRYFMAIAERVAETLVRPALLLLIYLFCIEKKHSTVNFASIILSSSALLFIIDTLLSQNRDTSYTLISTLFHHKDVKVMIVVGLLLCLWKDYFKDRLAILKLAIFLAIITFVGFFNINFPNVLFFLIPSLLMLSYDVKKLSPFPSITVACILVFVTSFLAVSGYPLEEMSVYTPSFYIEWSVFSILLSLSYVAKGKTKHIVYLINLLGAIGIFYGMIFYLLPHQTTIKMIYALIAINIAFDVKQQLSLSKTPKIDVA